MNLYFCLLAYAILFSFLMIENYLRRGSKDLHDTKTDHSSTKLVSTAMSLSFILVILVPFLNFLQIGVIPSVILGVIGASLSIVGLIIRIFALRTLGRFFTRTLQKTVKHTLVTNGIYRYIRHPGYLANILIFLGISLTLQNWLFISFVVVIYPIVYLYRIKTEEKMLIGIFGQTYRDYQKTSKKLIPFIF